jgi:hypothetical protein
VRLKLTRSRCRPGLVFGLEVYADHGLPYGWYYLFIGPLDLILHCFRPRKATPEEVKEAVGHG